MDCDRDSGFAGRLAVVETGRRWRWSAAEKVRIVEESLAGYRQAAATARRYGLPNSLLFKWRKAYREGCLGGGAVPAGFVAAVLRPGEAPAAVTPSPGAGRMEIVLAADRRVVVGADVDAAALARVLSVLERRG